MESFNMFQFFFVFFGMGHWLQQEQAKLIASAMGFRSPFSKALRRLDLKGLDIGWDLCPLLVAFCMATLMEFPQRHLKQHTFEPTSRYLQ